MNVTEIDNVFHCDCGFSWQRGKSGAHDCAVGLRAQRDQLAAENASLTKFIEDDCWVPGRDEYIDAAQCVPETPTTVAWQREQMAKGVDALAQRLEGLVAVSVTQGFIQQFAAQLRNGEAV